MANRCVSLCVFCVYVCFCNCLFHQKSLCTVEVKKLLLVSVIINKTDLQLITSGSVAPQISWGPLDIGRGHKPVK